MGAAGYASYIWYADSYYQDLSTGEGSLKTELLANENDSEQFLSPIDSQTPNDSILLISRKNKQISQLKNLLNTQNQQIEELKQIVANLEKMSSTDQATKPKPALKNMSYDDFENSMKESFTNRFKNVVLEMSDELESVKSSFEQSSETNEWSSNYEGLISNYLAEHNDNGDHFVQSLSCNTRICRLEVNTNDASSWDSLYAGMTSESWFESLTIQEKSDYQGNVIYYLPSFNN
jgi:hypothetical protein